MAVCAVAAVLGVKLRGAKAALKKPQQPEQRQNVAVTPAPAPVQTPLNTQTAPPSRQGPAELRVSQVQGIGKRDYQQDSMGFLPVSGGVFAVVADGMGGLADGDKVSQKIVQTMLSDAANHSVQEIGNNLMQLLSHTNAEVNQMLGPSEQYRSGSTLLAVAAGQDCFRWVTVGDSRIYLYRSGALLQINREHVYQAELLNLAVNRIINFSDALSNPQGKNVTSFIGMGNLKHIDLCLNPVHLLRGDRIALMSDGVFNAVSERELAEIFAACPDGNQAVAAVDAAVKKRNDPHQDNYSLILIDC